MSFRFLVAAAALSSAAQAQPPADLAGTIAVQSHPLTSAGELNGCEMTFDAMVRDRTYRAGKYTKVAGGITLIRNTATGAVFGLKIVLHDYDIRNGKAIDVMAAPTYATIELASGDALPRPGAHHAGDPAGLLEMWTLTDPVIQFFADVVDQKAFTVLFNRREGGADVRVPLDLTISEVDDNFRPTHSNEAVETWSRCVVRFVDKLQKGPGQ